MISSLFVAVVILAAPTATPAAAPKAPTAAPKAAPAAAAAPARGGVRQANPSNLESVVAAAKPGETVQLAGGKYPVMSLAARKAAPGIVIESAPGAQAEFLDGGKLGNCAGITLRRVTLSHYFGVTNCERVVIEDVLFQGDPSKFALPPDMGVAVRGARDVVIRNNRFRYLAWAVQHQDNVNLVIEGNDVQYIRYDGVRGGMGSTNVVIRNNRFSNFYAAAEAHRDGIQLWPGPKGARDIVVEGNILLPGETEGRFQHIFIGPDGGGGYDNLVVRGNVSLGAANHGIAIAGARSGEVSDNFVQAMPGFGSVMGITRVEGQPRNWNNASPGKLTSDDPKRPNTVVKPAKGLTDRAAYEAWAAAHGRRPAT